MENNITINQAYYGEVDRSHGCLYSTINDPDLKSFLTAFTDRPSSLPPGVSLSAYYSGMRFEKYYILTRTCADPTAVRGGMVFTHALILNVDDLHLITDIAELFVKFRLEKPAVFTILPLQIVIKEKKDSPILNDIPLYIKKVVSNLIDNEHPVIFRGRLNSFEKVVCLIWSGLPYSFRKEFSFTAGFSPNHIDTNKKVIYVQESLATIFSNLNLITDEEDIAKSEWTEVEKFILLEEDNNAFDLFIRSLSVSLSDWNVLSYCVKSYNLYSKLTDEISGAEVRLLIRNLGKISPDPTKGTVIKSASITKLAELISNGQETNIKALRNLNLDGFSNGRKELGQAIKKLFIGMFSKTIPLDTKLLSELFKILPPQSKDNWWQLEVSEALSQCTALSSNAALEALFTLLSVDFSAIAPVVGYIPNNKSTESLLIKHLPRDFSKENSQQLALEITPRKWYLLHAHLILMIEKPKEAVLNQLNYELKYSSDNFTGTRYLIPHLNDDELLSLCLLTKNKILIEEYGSRTIEKPCLLEPLNLSDMTWLQIWSESLALSNDLSHGISDLTSKVYLIFDLMIQKIPIPGNVIDQILNSIYTDLTAYPQRTKIWDVLPAHQKSIYVNATVSGILPKIAAGTVTAQLESQVSQSISDDHIMTKYLSDYRNDISSVLNIYEVTPKLKDTFLADYLSYYNGHITEQQSLSLGTLVKLKKLSFSARQIFEKAKNNQVFKFALSQCKHLIDFSIWEKLWYGNLLGEVVTDSLIYQALLENALKLYDKGPEERDLWKRAGGENFKFANNRTREESWRDAIGLLQRGGGGTDINTISLLEKMLEDYPQNNEIKELTKYFKRK